MHVFIEQSYSRHGPGTRAEGQARHVWSLPRILVLALVSCRMFSVLRNTMSTRISSFCHNALLKGGRAEPTVLPIDKWSPLAHAQLKVFAHRHRAWWCQAAHSGVPGSLCDAVVPLPSWPLPHSRGSAGLWLSLLGSTGLTVLPLGHGQMSLDTHSHLIPLTPGSILGTNLTTCWNS